MVIESSIMNPGQSLSLCCWDKDLGGAAEFCVKQPSIYSAFESITFLKQRIVLTSTDLTSARFHDECFYLSEVRKTSSVCRRQHQRDVTPKTQE